MPRKWRYKAEVGRIKGLRKGGVYEFEPKTRKDGSVDCKIRFKLFDRRMRIGYSSIGDFEEDWEEV